MVWKLNWTSLNSFYFLKLSIGQAIYTIKRISLICWDESSAHKFIPINKTSSLTQPRAYYSYIFLSCAEPRHEASVCDGWSLHALSVDRCCRSRGIFILPPLSLPTSIFLIHLLQPTSIHLSPPLMILATKLQILVIPCGDWP
jgi:hypothetical protein